MAPADGPRDRTGAIPRVARRFVRSAKPTWAVARERYILLAGRDIQRRSSYDSGVGRSHTVSDELANGSGAGGAAVSAPSTGTIRVFLLDDHEVVRRGLRDLLAEAPDVEVVGEAGRADDALRQILALRPNVAVLDARLEDGSGIEVCRQVRSADSRIACLILTSFDDEEALFTAIMAGAAGYVLKQIRGTALVDAVRQVAAGKSLLDPAVTPRVLVRLREGPAEDERLSGLTDQERRILRLIAEGLTNRQIANRMFLAEKTVKNYVSSMLAKLGLESRTQAAVFATRLNTT
jgi:two-component system response regulator DevR